MRKTVDYFCHLAVKPDFYSQLTHDAEFQSSKYADKIKWLAKDYDDIYDPDYGDMLRVSFMHQFRRGKLAVWLVCFQDEILLRRNLEKIL